jgi:hypothetical protein
VGAGVACMLYARFELLVHGPRPRDYTKAIVRLPHLSIRNRS